MVAGDDSSHFITGGVRSSCFFKSPRRRDHELIGGKNQFGGDTILRFWLSLHDKTRPAFPLSRENICGTQHAEAVAQVAQFRERRRVGLFEIDMEEARTP